MKSNSSHNLFKLTILMNRIALGTAQFGMPYGIANKEGKIELNEAKRILDVCKLKQIDTLDTAMAYGDSEKSLGFLGVDKYKVVTKLPLVPINCSDIDKWIREQVTHSFSQLNVNRIYALLLHHPQSLLEKNGPEIYLTLKKLQEENLINKIGVSIYSPSDLSTILNSYSIDIIQAPFNLIDQRLLKSGWLAKLRSLGIEIHIRSIFLQGLLLLEENKLPKYFSKWNPLWKNWFAWLRDSNLSPIDACASFALSFPEIDRLIIGVDNSSQLRQIFNCVSNETIKQWPNIQSNDEALINPSNWPKL